MTKQDAIGRLREFLKPGDTVHTITRHVSRSGMSRNISLIKVEPDGSTFTLDRLVIAAGVGHNPIGRGEGVRIGGCGMDMGFALVYELSRTLFPDGFGCVGQRCPSNDHGNGDRDYTPHTSPFSVECPPGTHVHWQETKHHRKVVSGKSSPTQEGTMQYVWKLLVRGTNNHHIWFDAWSGRIALADHSADRDGRPGRPHETDDGVLWLDYSRPVRRDSDTTIMVPLENEYGDKSWTVMRADCKQAAQIALMWEAQGESEYVQCMRAAGWI